MKALPWLLGAAGLAAARSAVLRVREVEFHGKVTLVTGASRGLGYLIARELGRQGCRVVICARDEAELERAAGALRGEGIDVHAVAADIAHEADVERMVRSAEEQVGPIDVLVNNAGIMEVGPFTSMTVQDFEDCMGVMFWGGLFCVRAVLPGMRERRSGWIINVTSIGGKISAPHLLPYNSAKFAAVGLSEGLRAELAADGIAVTTVCPGFMRTGSYVNVVYKSQPQREFVWFAAGSSLPIATMNAERAAAHIVRAARRGQAEIFPVWWAPWAARFHGLFPGITADAMGLFNRFLPDDSGADHAEERGLIIERAMESPLVSWLTTLGRAAGQRWHEIPGNPHPLQGEERTT